MRILNITAQKPDSTGSGVFLAEMVKSFSELGHEVAVIAGITHDDTPTLPDKTAFFPVYFQSDELPFPVVGMSDEMPYRSTRYCDMTAGMVESFERVFTKALDEALREFTPDIIICHHLYMLSAVVRERVRNVPLMVICHSTDIRQMLKHNLEKERIRKAMQRVDVIGALHSEQKREIVEVYGVDPCAVHLIGTGYNSDIFRNNSSNNQSSTRFGLVYAGKIWGKKGVFSLIRSLDLPPLADETTSLRLAGGHGSKDEYASIKRCAEAANHSIEFLGKLPQEELAKEYRGAEVFVLPSFFEGLPLVVIEALACGCKVVMTDLPGIRPWIQREVPDAPIIYVAPPEMKNTDEPLEGSLPAFERRLSSALCESLSETYKKPCDVSHLCWKSLCCRVLGLMK